MFQYAVRNGLTAIVLMICLTACNSQSVRTSTVQRPPVTRAPIPEHLLLDVGVNLLDPGIQYLEEGKSLTTPSVRRAESIQTAGNISKTLQGTGNWGAVRIIPNAQSETDVYVNGTIIESDGETLILEVNVADSSGKDWYTRKYTDQLSHYAYDPAVRKAQEPFRELYDAIAIDMEEYARALPPAKRQELRAISKLRFAQRFAPNDYNDFMSVDTNGRYTLKRLPAESDPVIQHVEAIRVRDQMFVDVLQDHYATYNQRMSQPYDQWREASYHETKALRELEQEATAKKIGGVLAVVAGILAQGSGSSTARSAGVIGIGAGALVFKSGLDQGSEAKIHEEALKEMADSLGAGMEPQTVALENKSVTLRGTVDEQYAQWRAILQEIYLTEIGQLPPSVYTDQPE